MSTVAHAVRPTTAVESDPTADRDRVIYLTFLVNVLTLAFSAVVGVLSGSNAVMAMAVHALSDSVVAGVVLLKAYGKAPKPESSFQSTLRQSSILFVAGLWICLAALAKLISGPMHPGLFAVVVSAVSLVVSWRLFVFTNRVSQKLDDGAVKVCRTINRMNFITGGLSFVGVVLADLDLKFCDPLSAVIIGAILLASAIGSFPRLLQGKAGPERRLALLPVAALTIGVVGYIAYDHRRSTDVVLIPSAGPTLDSPIEPLLGRARYFLIVSRSKGRYRVIVNGARDYKGDVSRSLVSTVKGNDVDSVVAQRIGEEVYGDLRSVRIKMYYTSSQTTVRGALGAFRHGRLEQAASPNVGRGFGRKQPRWLTPW